MALRSGDDDEDDDAAADADEEEEALPSRTVVRKPRKCRRKNANPPGGGGFDDDNDDGEEEEEDKGAKSRNHGDNNKRGGGSTRTNWSPSGWEPPLPRGTYVDVNVEGDEWAGPYYDVHSRRSYGTLKPPPSRAATDTRPPTDTTRLTRHDVHPCYDSPLLLRLTRRPHHSATS